MMDDGECTSDSDIGSNDITSDESSSDSSDFVDSDTDYQVLKLRHPSSVIVYGQTMCGKTSFIIELMYAKAFDVDFKYIYLVIGGLDSMYDMSKKAKEFIKAVRDCFPNVSADKITIFASLEMLVLHLKNQDMSEEELSAPKLGILDDILTTSVRPAAIDDVFNAGVHHKSLSVIVTVQKFFQRDGKSMKDSSVYLVIFPQVPLTTRNRLMGDLPIDARRIVNAFFAGQSADSLSVLTNTRYCQPVIIDRGAPDNGADIVIYRGMHDSEPVKVRSADKELPINPEQEMNSLIESVFGSKRQKLTGEASSKRLKTTD